MRAQIMGGSPSESPLISTHLSPVSTKRPRSPCCSEKPSGWREAQINRGSESHEKRNPTGAGLDDYVSETTSILTRNRKRRNVPFGHSRRNRVERFRHVTLYEKTQMRQCRKICMRFFNEFLRFRDGPRAAHPACRRESDCANRGGFLYYVYGGQPSLGWGGMRCAFSEQHSE